MISNPFNISRSPKLIFGVGIIYKLNQLCKQYGNGVLLVTGGESYNKSVFKLKIENNLHKEFTLHHYPVSGEPSPEVIDNAVQTYRDKNINVVVSIGGGSVMDAGKAIAAMLLENGSVADYLEGIGTKQPSGRRLPLIAIPTTAGTGSEATKNAVITKLGIDGFKKSLRHDNYTPDIALIDPELTASCNPQQTAASGMDGFTQLLESYLSTKANPYTDSMALSGLNYIAKSLERSVIDGTNIEARSAMSYAAYLSGLCLANAGLGLIHGFAQPLGSLFPIPHGIVCGTLMGAVNRRTVTQLRNSDPQSIFLKKYAVVGQLFYSHQCSQNEYITLLLDKIDYFITEFNIPKLSEFGVQVQHANSIIKYTSHKNHPIKFNEHELIGLITECL